MAQQAMPPALPAPEATAVGGRLVFPELHVEPTPFHLSVADPLGPQQQIAKPDTRPMSAVLVAAPVASPPWTPSTDALRSRRRLEMPTALARLLPSGSGAGVRWGGRPSSSSSFSPEDAELECYLIEGRAYRRQRLPFGQGHLARGAARRGAADADALWDHYMALDAGQKACVDRLLRRKTRTSTRPRTCVAITPCADTGGNAAGDGPTTAAEAASPVAATGGTGGKVAIKPPNFLVFLAVGHPVAPVRFRDPLGRRFEFSFELCRTWAGMEKLLLDCFPLGHDADAEGPDGGGSSIDARVRRGHYDLLGPDGHIVLPMVWESIVRPGWRVSMALWPEVLAWEPRAAQSGPRSAAAAPGRLWQKALGVLRAPFEGRRHSYTPPPPRAAAVAPVPMAETRREAPRETLFLRQPRLGSGDGEARAPGSIPSRRVSPARFRSPPEGFRRHSSDMPGDPRSWYAASLPRHMAMPARRNSATTAAWGPGCTPRPGRRLSPVYSAAMAPGEEGDTRSIVEDGSAGAASDSSQASSPSSSLDPVRTEDDDEDGRASQSSSMPDCDSEALEAASLSKGIDDLLGRWASVEAEPAHKMNAGGKARGGKEGEGSEAGGE